MSEFGGLWNHENNQRALVPPKRECGCPSGGGIKNGHIRYPSYGRTQKKRKKTTAVFTDLPPEAPARHPGLDVKLAMCGSPQLLRRHVQDSETQRETQRQAGEGEFLHKYK